MTGATRARRASSDLSAWWSNKTAPPLNRQQSAPHDAQYHTPQHPDLIPHPSNRRRSLDCEAPPAPTSVSGHLHYRDPQWASAQDVLDSGDTKLQDEERSLAAALEQSRRDDDEKRAKTFEIEDQDLRRALAESTRLARSNPSLAEKEQAELSQALLASQRQLLIDSHPSRPPRSSQRPATASMSRSSSSNSLEESEWALMARNEKGSLYREAGAHGWLPPGASRAGTEEDREMEMLEIAIRISLQEEEERRKRDEEMQQQYERTTRPPLYGQGSDSTRYSSYATAPSDFSSSSAPEIQSSPPKPKRKLPPLPPHIFTEQLSPPTSPHISSPGQDHAPPLPPNPYSPSHATHPQQPPPLPSPAPLTPPQSDLQPSPNHSNLEPPRVEWSENELSRSGSPYELPYLTSSPSMRHSSASYSPIVGQSEQSHDTGTSGEWSGPSRSSGSSRSLASERGSQQQAAQLNHRQPEAEEDPLEALTVRNPDPSATPPPAPTRAPPPPPPAPTPAAEVAPISPSFPTFESTMTGRSLSLVSEATEPPSPSSASSGPPPQLFGGDRRSHSPPVQSPTLMQALQRGPPEAPAVSQATHGHEDEAEPVAEESREEEEPTSFGDGVRFGYPQACAHEEDHVCSMDGLGSTGPFPSEVILSSSKEDEERSAFSVEARSWPGLLRFLMWYGETTLRASPADVTASPHHHCDAALSLSFRSDDLGASILRLTFSILPPHEHGNAPDPELTIAAPPAALSSGKGKGKARASAASRPSTTYMLPDHISLPSRLANSAHTLYSLRHLAQIAFSTQPSKHASPSYHALRSLAQSIQQLASSQQQQAAQQQTSDFGAEAGPTAAPKGDDLVGRLRERLRRMRGSKVGSNGNGAGGGSSSSAKLQKAPPLAIVERTQAVRRRERVLTAEEEDHDYEDSEDYQEAREQDEIRRREEEALATETRYLPTLGR